MTKYEGMLKLRFILLPPRTNRTTKQTAKLGSNGNRYSQIKRPYRGTIYDKESARIIYNFIKILNDGKRVKENT
jgi:hypothetical protein